jgi:hypothetical protein
MDMAYDLAQKGVGAWRVSLERRLVWSTNTTQPIAHIGGSPAEGGGGRTAEGEDGMGARREAATLYPSS